MSGRLLSYHAFSDAWSGQTAMAIRRLLSSVLRFGRKAARNNGRSQPPGCVGSSSEPVDVIFAELARALLSCRGEASVGTMAEDLLALYAGSSETQKAAILRRLGECFGPDRESIERAWALYQDKGEKHLPSLAAAIEAPRKELFRRLNFSPSGSSALVSMRADLHALLSPAEEAAALIEADLHDVLQWCFNRGFLELKPITWSSPASLLESVIKFEAVHQITGWEDLRNRLNPPDRRCYGFFHQAMPQDLLIFVEVALTRGMADNVQNVLLTGRDPLSAHDADTANFYSISNCQVGLRGISFGHFLIKQVVLDLQRELPNLTTFCTLSPIPGFMNWLFETSHPLLDHLKPGWQHSNHSEEIGQRLAQTAARYLLNTRNSGNLPRDPVARFHLGNGARLERVHAFADMSEKGLSESAGVMVNYRYDLPTIADNHEAYLKSGIVAAAHSIIRLSQEHSTVAAA